jgi:hypothetical protein
MIFGVAFNNKPTQVVHIEQNIANVTTASQLTASFNTVALAAIHAGANSDQQLNPTLIREDMIKAATITQLQRLFAMSDLISSSVMIVCLLVLFSGN